MRKKFLNRKSVFYLFVLGLSLMFLLLDFTSSLPAPLANVPSQKYYQGTVQQILKEGTKKIHTSENPYQEVTVIFRDKKEQNEVTLIHGGERMITKDQLLTKGQKVILATSQTVEGKTQYVIWDQYRLPQVAGIIAAFFFVVFFITGKKSLGSLFGLGFSLLVIVKGIIPLIMLGYDPLIVSIGGSLIILSVGIYLAHGLTEETTLAVIATFLSLILTGILAVLFVKIAHLTGVGSEDASALQIRFSDTINFQGLLLGGIIIGALGVLDDVTTAQTTTVYELSRTDERLPVRTLITKGMRVGREHITSLVNTLVLAYAGASIGVFIYILLGLQQGNVPLWVILNSEFLVEEVVRTLAGSLGLVLAVPISTVLAAVISKYSIKIT